MLLLVGAELNDVPLNSAASKRKARGIPAHGPAVQVSGKQARNVFTQFKIEKWHISVSF